MIRYMKRLRLLLLGAATLAAAAPVLASPFEASRIFIEYNQTDNDLGFHVFLDAPEWTSARIVNPAGVLIFDVAGKGPYGEMGLSELFFEGAEPNLDDFPLEDLLALFPEGKYKFIGVTPDGKQLTGMGTLSHAVPDGPVVSAEVNGDEVVISWDPVTLPPPGFPQRTLKIVGYQVIVDPFQVTVPADTLQVTLPPEFVQSLPKGAHDFEVLAIDQSGNQTITADSFETP